jgi:hypothetical protein
MTDAQALTPANVAESANRSFFISYARTEVRFAAKLQGSLKAHWPALRDESDIPPGELWEDEIRKMIKTVETVVVILSPQAVHSKYVKAEIRIAEKLKKELVPILHQECDDADIPLVLVGLQQIDFRFTYKTSLIALLKRTPTPTPSSWIRFLRKIGMPGLVSALTILFVALVYGLFQLLLYLLPSRTEAALSHPNDAKAISVLLENHGPKTSTVIGPYQLNFRRLPIEDTDLQRVDKSGDIVPANGRLEISLSTNDEFTPRTLSDGSAKGKKQMEHDLKPTDCIELRVGVKESNESTGKPRAIPICYQTIEAFVVPRLPDYGKGARDVD